MNRKMSLLLSSPLPMVLNEILLKLKVGVCIFNLLVCLKKSSNAVRVSSWFDTATHIVVEELQVHASLIFENHIVKNNTACHDIFQGPLVPKTSRTTNNGKPRLQNPECSFNVFSGCLLHPCKFTLFSSFGFFDALDKCAPRRIYTICKIVPLCVFMHIDSVVASRSITTSKLSKQTRPLQHIDIIASARHTKKVMP